jgi:hypothetical protein
MSWSDPSPKRTRGRRPGLLDAPRLLTPGEFDRFADVVASVATAHPDTSREDVVMAGEVLDRLSCLRHLMTDPPDFQPGWRR